MSLRPALPFFALALSAALGCSCKGASAKSEGAVDGAAAAPGEPPPPPPDAPKLGAIALKAFIYEKPAKGSRKLGYLRLGAQVARGESPAGTEGCASGWYSIHPRGYVCVSDEDATLNLGHPLLKAAALRPDVTKPMPYRYGFVRAHAPLYLRVPAGPEQFQAEYGLEEHLQWWKTEGQKAQQAALGANDVPLDARGVPVKGGVLGSLAPKTTDLTEAQLFAAQTDTDPMPFWLTDSGDRSVPNISGFKVPPAAIFANRVRRHTGLAFIGSFTTGPEKGYRRFAITTDLRIVPTSKVKPDAASAFHGFELGPEHTLPFGLVRKDTTVFSVSKSRAQKGEAITRMAIVKPTGNTKTVKGTLYREIEGGKWLKGTDLGIVATPKDLPPVAHKGEKWVDVSIENQVLVLYEGTKPVYVTLVSTGQDGLEDHRTSKATIRGTFRIQNKHVTTTMDSNESPKAPGEDHVEKDLSNETGDPAAAATAGKPARAKKRSKDKDKSASGDKEATSTEPSGGGGEPKEPKKKKEGGFFELRDVPWVQYFEQGYALHAAYWHDVFGTPRSHGCVNLSPVDALRVFRWTEPAVPSGWHSVVPPPDTGTTVHIRR